MTNKVIRFIFFLILTFLLRFNQFLISLLLKNIAASLVVFIGVYIFELIIRAFFAIMSISWGQYLPFNVFSNLCDAPSFEKMMTNPMIKESIANATITAQANGQFTDVNYGLNTVLSIAFIAVFFYLSYLILKKKDL